MTDLVFPEPAQRELEEIAKIHMNLAGQIPQKKFNEPDSGYAFPTGTVSAIRSAALQHVALYGQGSIFLFFCSTKKRHPFRDVFFRGAGEGNRTLNASLGSSNFTTKLRPHMRPAEPANDIILSFVQNFNYFSWNPAAFLF